MIMVAHIFNRSQGYVVRPYLREMGGGGICLSESDYSI